MWHMQITNTIYLNIITQQQNNAKGWKSSFTPILFRFAVSCDVFLYKSFVGKIFEKISGGRLLATQEYVKYHHSLTHIEIGNRIDHGLRKAFDDPMVAPHLSFYTCYFYAL